MIKIEWFEPRQRVIFEQRQDGLGPAPVRWVVGQDGVTSIEARGELVVVRRNSGQVILYREQGVMFGREEPCTRTFDEHDSITMQLKADWEADRKAKSQPDPLSKDEPNVATQLAAQKGRRK